jgi:hypothetical protein
MFLIQTELGANCHSAYLLSVKGRPLGRPRGGLALQVKTGKNGADFVILGRVASQAYRTAAGLSSTGSSVVGNLAINAATVGDGQFDIAYYVQCPTMSAGKITAMSGCGSRHRCTMRLCAEGRHPTAP